MLEEVVETFHRNHLMRGGDALVDSLKVGLAVDLRVLGAVKGEHGALNLWQLGADINRYEMLPIRSGELLDALLEHGSEGFGSQRVVDTLLLALSYLIEDIADNN